MKKLKSIYEQPKRYARKCNIPIKYAREICKKQTKLLKEIRKNSKCPYCGKRELEMEWSEADYTCHSWIVCGNCGKEVDETVYKNIRVEEIGEDFDIFLWMSLDNMHFTKEEWIEFIKEHK
ncbi:hypothetical protein CS063_01445 [Sporanaerobium hydrogeniformans]|uniref:Uncharacterized protein n=1 Tax=Sporanaerobium hydrogeniformans TaxID=3072179 RepID=A0AC61DKF4_9FIRM|nr:hypothetical protein [Sporanaerobium hydrogeniformans]PHV72167.1 hypothetical protein CS063_01445 [Sporanaerobium hydrogeniformans]